MPSLFFLPLIQPNEEWRFSSLSLFPSFSLSLFLSPSLSPSYSLPPSQDALKVLEQADALAEKTKKVVDEFQTHTNNQQLASLSVGELLVLAGRLSDVQSIFYLLFSFFSSFFHCSLQPNKCRICNCSCQIPSFFKIPKTNRIPSFKSPGSLPSSFPLSPSPSLPEQILNFFLSLPLPLF